MEFHSNGGCPKTIIRIPDLSALIHSQITRGFRSNEKNRIMIPKAFSRMLNDSRCEFVPVFFRIHWKNYRQD
jgi:hypothetical protein